MRLIEVSRISLTRPQMAQQVTELLVRMGQQGQIRGKVTDEALKGLLAQVRWFRHNLSESQWTGIWTHSFRGSGSCTEERSNQNSRRRYHRKLESAFVTLLGMLTIRFNAKETTLILTNTIYNATSSITQCIYARCIQYKP